jgi:hypothetical protein
MLPLTCVQGAVAIALSLSSLPLLAECHQYCMWPMFICHDKAFGVFVNELLIILVEDATYDTFAKEGCHMHFAMV